MKNEITNITQPDLESIEFLPICLTLLQGIRNSNENHYDTLSKAKYKPYVLDKHTIQRTIRLFSEQKEDFLIWEEYLNQASQMSLSAAQHDIMQQVRNDFEEIKRLNSRIMGLARELEPYAIDRVLTKDMVDKHEQRLMTLTEYKEDFNRKYDKDKHRKNYTNIKCEKCDGQYYFVRNGALCMTVPVQREIICDKCYHKTAIPVN
jgi:hypothetical protein